MVACAALARSGYHDLPPLKHRRSGWQAIAGPAPLCNYRVTELTKLYVGNLPFSATEESVRALFAPHGTVETLALINDRETGRPRGFGFVEMSNADAARAIEALNGVDFDGRALKVNEAQARSGGNGGGHRRY